MGTCIWRRIYYPVLREYTGLLIIAKCNAMILICFFACHDICIQWLVTKLCWIGCGFCRPSWCDICSCMYMNILHKCMFCSRILEIVRWLYYMVLNPLASSGQNKPIYIPSYQALLFHYTINIFYIFIWRRSMSALSQLFGFIKFD